MICNFSYCNVRLKGTTLPMGRLENNTFQYIHFYGSNQLRDLDLYWNMILLKQLFEITELTYSTVRLCFLYTRQLLLDFLHTGSFFVGVIILRRFISYVMNKSCLFTFSYAQPDEGHLE
jgi:hypothetical protein